MIDRKRKLLFIHIARTGGTSIETALVGTDWWKKEPESKHLSASQTRLYYGEETWSSYVKFSIVRNPWDRLVSMWATKWWHQDMDSEEDDFHRFVLQLKLHPHEKYNSLCYTEILDEEIEYTLRFENLQSEFSNMLHDLGLKNVKLPHKEKRNRENYRKYYNQETIEVVLKMFQKDIDTYGYQF